MPTLEHHDFISPSALTMLRRTLDCWCGQHGLPLNSPQATKAAQDLVNFYQIGARDPRQLIELLELLQPLTAQKAEDERTGAVTH